VSALERYRLLREELRPRQVVFYDGKPYRDAVCELWDALEEAEKALAACKPVGAEFCNWCWHNPPHDDGCPIAATEKG